MNTSNLTANLLDILFPWRKTRLVDQLGGEAARECRFDFWLRIRHPTRNMDIPEIRGYARAQAADVLPAEVERVLERHRVGPALKNRALAAGIEQIVGMVVRDALSEPYSADPEKIAA